MPSKSNNLANTENQGFRPVTNVIMEKVRYTREEYRKEYLRSEEWKKLRSLVLKADPECQCCHKTKATDAHHMTYKNIVDIQPSDLLPVCRSCHKFIHEAIRDGYLSQNPKNINEIREKTKHILYDEEYEKLREWLKCKHHLSEEDKAFIIKDKRFILLRRVRGLTKKDVTIDNLNDVKFTGRQILKIREMIQIFLYRQKNGLDKERRAKYSKRFRQNF